MHAQPNRGEQSELELKMFALLLAFSIIIVAVIVIRMKRSNIKPKLITFARIQTDSVDVDSSEKIKVVVTGGCGCLGKEIIRQLLASNRYVVHCLDIFIPPKDKRMAGVAAYIQTDIANFSDVSRALQGMEVVFHTAGLMPISIYNTPEAMERVNLKGTKNVVKACKQCGVKRLIYTSSCTVLLSKDPKLHTEEEMDEFSPFPKVPLNAYVHTKGKAEIAVREANGENRLRTCALRLGGLLGGDSQAQKRMMDSKVVRLGKGDYLMAWTYLKSAGEVHLLAEHYLAEKPVSASTNVFNVISTNSKYRDVNSSFSFQNTGKMPTEFPLWPVKVLAFLNESVYCLTGLAPLGSGLYPSRLQFLVPHSFSSNHAEKELGWVEKRTLKQIVSDCIADYRAS